MINIERSFSATTHAALYCCACLGCCSDFEPDRNASFYCFIGCSNQHFNMSITNQCAERWQYKRLPRPSKAVRKLIFPRRKQSHHQTDWQSADGDASSRSLPIAVTIFVIWRRNRDEVLPRHIWCFTPLIMRLTTLNRIGKSQL